MYKDIKKLLVVTPQKIQNNVTGYSVIYNSSTPCANNNRLTSIKHDFYKNYKTYEYKSEVLDNIPTPNCIISNIKYHNNREVFTITDPRGFSVNVEPRYVFQLMSTCTIINNIIQNPIIWLKDKQHIVPVESSNTNIKPITKDGVTANKLEYGDYVTIDVNSKTKTYIYLGKCIFTYTIGYYGYFSNNNVNQWKSTGALNYKKHKEYILDKINRLTDIERHLFFDVDRKEFITSCNASCRYIRNVNMKQSVEFVNNLLKTYNPNGNRYRYLTPKLSDSNREFEKKIYTEIKKNYKSLESISSKILDISFESTNLKHTFKKMVKSLK